MVDFYRRVRLLVCFGSLVCVMRQPLTGHGLAFFGPGPNQRGNSREADFNRGQCPLACPFHAQLTMLVFDASCCLWSCLQR